MTYSFDDLIKDKVGVGKYQLLLFLTLSSVDLAEGVQLTLMSLLVPLLQKQWTLSPLSVKCLSSVFFLGVIIGTNNTLITYIKYRRKTPNKRLIFFGLFQ